jgi:aqualysin 1
MRLDLNRTSALAALLTLSFAVPLAAQQGAPVPMIVVLQDNVRFEDFEREFAPDARGNANPPAWGYLNRGVAGAVQFLERRGGFQSDHVYSHAIRGFAARLTPAQAQQLQFDPLVKYVEPDGVMTTVAQTTPWGITKINAAGAPTVTGVNVYVIDTGIANHSDLNKKGHVNFAGGQNNDCHGHGTHVAGTIAAINNTLDVVGVAPGAPLYGVKVLSCSGSGSTSGVIKGVDWVTANAKKPAVANMSLGGGASTALDDAVRRSVAGGVFYALAAGNSGADACNSSPARAGAGTDNGIMTTGALDSADQDPSWSNWGQCLDIWAPGVSILSTRRGGGTTTMSGTSMASPHVAGTAALLLGKNPGWTPVNVETSLRSTAVNTGTTANDGAAIKRVDAATYK